MKPQSDVPKDEQACEPEWVKLNHLFSYCAKTKRGHPQPSGEQPHNTGARQCTRKACLFSAKWR